MLSVHLALAFAACVLRLKGKCKDAMFFSICQIFGPFKTLKKVKEPVSDGKLPLVDIFPPTRAKKTPVKICGAPARADRNAMFCFFGKDSVGA